MRPDNAAISAAPGAHAHRGRASRTRRSRLLPSATAGGIAATLAAALLALGAGGRIAPRPASAAQTQAPALPVAVWVHARDRGAPVAQRFLGLSFEVSSLPQIAEYAQRGDLVTLLRSLGPGILRFGGASADSRVAWTDQMTPRPAWASSVLDPADLRRLRTLARESGWRVMLTLGLAHYEPRAAAREAAAAKAALGPWLAAIEVGNEPDAYGLHHFRTLPWTYQQYATELNTYRSAIASAAPGIPLAGPDVSGSRIFEHWATSEAAGEHPALLTGHHYPLGCEESPAATIPRLLSTETRRLENESLARFITVSRASGLGVRLDETGSVSCGGRPGISNTFASALWAVDYIARAMAAGAAGINLEGNPANCRGYSPLCAPTPAELAAGALRVQPVWYALLLTMTLLGDRPLRTSVSSPKRADVAATALQAPYGGLRVVLVNDDAPGTGTAAISLHVGGAGRPASVLVLSAPALTARSGVELGGTAVSPAGSWSGPHRLTPAKVSDGAVSVSVPAASAVLVTVAPARASHPGTASTQS